MAIFINFLLECPTKYALNSQKYTYLCENRVMKRRKFYFSTQTSVISIILWVITAHTRVELVYLWFESAHFVGHFRTDNLTLSGNVLHWGVFVCCWFDTFITSCQCLKYFWLRTVNDLLCQALNFIIIDWLSINWCLFYTYDASISVYIALSWFMCI